MARNAEPIIISTVEFDYIGKIRSQRLHFRKQFTAGRGFLFGKICVIVWIFNKNCDMLWLHRGSATTTFTRETKGEYT